jgi:hypothetical protein
MESQEKKKAPPESFPTSAWPAIRALVLLLLVIAGLCFLAYLRREPRQMPPSQSNAVRLPIEE